MDKCKLNLFEIFSLAWISVATGGLVLALLGIFNTILLILLLASILVCLFSLYIKGKFIFVKPEKTTLLIVAVLLVISLGLSYYTSSTIFGGRDEGTYSNAAILLAKDHGLLHQSEVISQFFQIYGPGKALNFPGFYYTPEGKLGSQFLPGYISYLAIFYSFFGEKALAWANILPFVTFLLSFYFILRKILRKELFLTTQPLGEKGTSARRFSLLGTAMLLTVFPLLLFYKYTLSEIYFAALLWFSFYLILRYFEKKSFGNYMLIFLPMIPMAFTRVELVGFYVILFFLFALKDFTHIRQPKYQFIYAIMGLVVAISLVYNSNFFIDTAKNVLEPFIENDPASGSASQPLLSDDLMDFYVPKVLYTYNILPFILLGAVYIIYLLKNKHLRLLIPFFFFLPTLVYLVDANISLDHPWMLRRFLFAIIPLFILYCTLFLHELAERAEKFRSLNALAYGIPLLVIVLNLALLIPGPTNFLKYSQNEHLFEQTQQIANRFSPNDLMLVTQNSSGSGWSLMSEPLRNLLGKQAVYFFNPNDFTKIDKSKFSNIYLVVSDKELPLYESLVKEKISDYTINNSIIEPLKNPLEKTKVSHYEIQGSIYRLAKD